ncbi:uncharacterized protein G2W53_020397 [Senna tora]|uniref:Uncharacterized protein n=1 Tax=Senna tora TaxID=362788 RepID=A0A834WQ27_9FABA|nr:uncharacterized protein G2W53_020397 [Senna tora]
MHEEEPDEKHMLELSKTKAGLSLSILQLLSNCAIDLSDLSIHHLM